MNRLLGNVVPALLAVPVCTALGLSGCSGNDDGSSSVQTTGTGMTTTMGTGTGTASSPGTLTSSGMPPGTTGVSTQGPTTTQTGTGSQDTGTVPLPNSLWSKIQNDPQFSQLESAIEFADMGPELLRATPRTVFAPTNAAFDALSERFKESLIADKLKMRAFLLLHVADGEIDTPQAASPRRSLAGPPITFGISSDGNTLVSGGEGSVTIRRENISASNGVIHEIEGVLSPPERTALQQIERRRSLSVFAQAVETSGLSFLLSGDGAMTVFPPNNDAFDDLEARMGREAYQALFRDKDALARLVRQHIYGGLLFDVDYFVEQDLQSLQAGSLLRIRVEDEPFGQPMVNGRGLEREYHVTNGFVQIVTGTLHDAGQ